MRIVRTCDDGDMFRTGEKRENRLERGQLRILMTGVRSVRIDEDGDW